MLSRSEGMETKHLKRELGASVTETLDMLSRSEGMETEW